MNWVKICCPGVVEWGTAIWSKFFPCPVTTGACESTGAPCGPSGGGGCVFPDVCRETTSEGVSGFIDQKDLPFSNNGPGNVRVDFNVRVKQCAATGTYPGWNGFDVIRAFIDLTLFCQGAEITMDCSPSNMTPIAGRKNGFEAFSTGEELACSLTAFLDFQDETKEVQWRNACAAFLGVSFFVRAEAPDGGPGTSVIGSTGYGLEVVVAITGTCCDRSLTFSDVDTLP